MGEVKRYEQMFTDPVSGQMVTFRTVPASDYDALAAECERLRGEVSDLHTTMMAAAVEIQEHWDAHCDAEGYGPANLMHRLEQGIASQYGYNAETVVRMEAQRDAALAELAALKGGQEAVGGDLSACPIAYAVKGSDVMFGTAYEAYQYMGEGSEPFALYTAPPAQASAWPEGWKLVPVCATSGMEDAYDEKCTADGIEHELYLPAYEAMLAAAPTPGASDGKGGDV